MIDEQFQEYRERQRQRFNGEGGLVEAALETAVPNLEISDRAVVGVVGLSQPSRVADLSEPTRPSLSKLHILPLISWEQRTAPSFTESVESARLEAVGNILAQCCSRKDLLEPGFVFGDSTGGRFLVAKTEPETGGVLVQDSDFFLNGPSAVVLKKIQVVALVDPSSEGSEEEADHLFRDSLGPFIQTQLGRKQGCGIPVHVNQVFTVGQVRYVASAMDPMPEGLGLITPDTLVYIDLERSGDFGRIHILPFQDTLPRVYDFDVFEDYLRPFFSSNPASLFSVNTQFVYHGVQFKVVCVDPSDGQARRIGPNTLIHCEGLLHASLRNMLPPELLEQVSTLPPGLQMLLINTELLASADMLDRFIDLQETLASRRGVSDEALNAISVERFQIAGESSGHRPESAVQCMICLSEFETGELLRRLPCTHVYHQPCIDEWLHRCTDCPLCKTNVETAFRSRAATSD